MSRLRLLLFMPLCAGLILGTSFGPSARPRADSTKQKSFTQAIEKKQKEGQPSPDVIGYLQALQARSDKAEALGWNSRSGTPRSIIGKMHSILKESSEASARLFLQGNAPLFKLNNDTDDLRLVREKESLVGKHFTFQQQYQGLDVYGAEVSIHFDKQGDIVTINNSYEPNIKIGSVTPRVNRANASA